MKIGNFDLETDGTFIIAEMPANHNGSLETALKTIKAAKDAGANANNDLNILRRNDDDRLVYTIYESKKELDISSCMGHYA